MTAAYLVVRVLKRRVRRCSPEDWSAAAVPLLACGMIYFGFTEWMRLTGRQPLAICHVSLQLIGERLGSIRMLFITNAHIFMVLLYSGLFLKLATAFGDEAVLAASCSRGGDGRRPPFLSCLC